MILPLPNAPFEWRNTAAGPALVCLALETHAAHFFTTRQWSIGVRTADVLEQDRGWRQIAEAIGVETGSLIRPHQVHGRAVLVATGPTSSTDADVVVSDRPELALAVQAADCVPILMTDRRTGVCAAAHAGWRGLALRVPTVAAAALAEEYGSRPSDLLVAVGPAIGPCCYEVGENVRERFEACRFERSELDRWFPTSPRASATNPSLPGLAPTARAGHWYFDAWQAARDQLTAAGIPGEQIHIAALCTASHADLFCSYRRDGTSAGRLAGAIRSLPRRP